MNRATQHNQERSEEGAPAPRPDDVAEQQMSAEQQMMDVQEQIAQLAAERDAANEKYLHALADFQNYQRRALMNEQEARRQGVTAVLSSILPVLDHFDLALNQPVGGGPAEAVMEGVRAIRAELIKALGAHGVTLINPAPNDEFDPNRHQAIMHGAPGDTGVQPGRVLATFQSGYALGDRVVRAAKVSVASEG
jgi:molecular chaperone GrpE